MIKPVSILLVSTLVLTSCGAVRDSRLNPFNWFGRSTSTATSAAEVAPEQVNPLIPKRRSVFSPVKVEDPGILISSVSELTVERRPGGALVLAVGTADRMGPYDARLKKVDAESVDGQLVYEFRIKNTTGPSGGNDRLRSVKVAVALSNQELETVRVIKVRAANNERVTRR